MTLSGIAGLLIVIGAFLPAQFEKPALRLSHTILCLTGSVIMIFAITLLIAIYCKRDKASTKKNIIIRNGYANP